MPTKTYTNKDLVPRREDLPQDRDLAYWKGDEAEFAGRGKRFTPPSTRRIPEREPSIDELLTQARGFLAKPSVVPDVEPESLPAERGLARNVTDVLSGQQMAESLAAGESGSVFDELNTRHPLASTVVSLASPLLNPTGAALSGLRKFIAPEADESRLEGAIETGFSVPLIRAMRVPGVKETISKGMSNAGRQFRALGTSREIPVGGGVQRATNPNQALEVARQIAGETGEPLEAVLAGGRQAGFNRPSQEALAKLAGSGMVGRTARLAAEAEKTPLAAREISSPGASRYIESQFGKNRDIAREILGRQVGAPGGEAVDLTAQLGNPRARRMQEFLTAFRQGRVYKPEF